MIQIHAAFEYKKDICANSIHSAQDRPYITRILGSYKGNSTTYRLKIFEAKSSLVKDGKDSLGVFLIGQRFHHLRRNRLKFRAEARNQVKCEIAGQQLWCIKHVFHIPAGLHGFADRMDSLHEEQ